MKFKLMIILLLIVSACNTIHQKDVTSSGPINLYFCPFVNCTKAILDHLTNATNISCAFYELTSKKLIQKLEEKNASVVLDEKSSLFFDKRLGPGLMHNKFCVIDESISISGSFNPTREQDYNNVIIIYSKPIAKFYMTYHAELLGKKIKKKRNVFVHNNHIIEIYTCPQDKCQEEIMQLIRNAKESITFALFTFTDNEISKALYEKSVQGVAVKGVIESFQQKKLNQYYYLKEKRVQVVLESTSLLQHNKIFVIDKEIVITGSYNPTKAAHTVNDENIIVIKNKEIAKVYEELVQTLINTTKHQ